MYGYRAYMYSHVAGLPPTAGRISQYQVMLICMYACVYVCMHMRMHVCIHTCLYIHTYAHGFICMHAYEYVSMHRQTSLAKTHSVVREHIL